MNLVTNVIDRVEPTRKSSHSMIQALFMKTWARKVIRLPVILAAFWAKNLECVF